MELAAEDTESDEDIDLAADLTFMENLAGYSLRPRTHGNDDMQKGEWQEAVESHVTGCACTGTLYVSGLCMH